MRVARCIESTQDSWPPAVALAIKGVAHPDLRTLDANEILYSVSGVFILNVTGARARASYRRPDTFCPMWQTSFGATAEVSHTDLGSPVVWEVQDGLPGGRITGWVMCRRSHICLVWLTRTWCWHQRLRALLLEFESKHRPLKQCPLRPH